MIQVTNLVKKYGNSTVLDIPELSISSPTILGLVGNNGAGKTTLLRIIAGFSKPSGGECKINGKDTFNNLGCSDQVLFIDEKMRYCGNLKLENILREVKTVNDTFDLDKALSLLERFGIDKGKKFDQLSKGMINIFNMTIGFASAHPIVIFDEITSGLDEFARIKFKETLIEEFGNLPKIYIVSTHLIGEISCVLQDLVLLKGGEIALDSPTEDLVGILVKLSGTEALMRVLMPNLMYYSNKVSNGYQDIVIKNELTRHAKIYMDQYGIKLTALPLSEICAYISNIEPREVVCDHLWYKL